MDQRPIGVFDSGLGGLTAVKQLHKALPNEDIIYLGDTGRVPYGPRSKETIIKYSKQAAAFLQERGVKAIVVACGTASSTAIDALEDSLTLPVFGVVGAAAAAAVNATKNRRVGVIATEATVRSGAYDRLIKQIEENVEVFGAQCPLFVPLVENGRTKLGDIVIETVAEEYLAPLRARDIDTLILGCTHYPLLYEVIAKTIGAVVTLIDSGAEGALLTARVLRERGLLSEAAGTGRQQYFVTDSTDGFSKLASLFLGSDVRGDVTQGALG